MSRRRIIGWTVATISAALGTLVVVYDGAWWGASGWFFAAFCWAFGDQLMRRLFLRKEASLLLRLSETVIVRLRQQGEDRPEVMDQTGWMADDLRACQPRLQAITERRERPSNEDMDSLSNREQVTALVDEVERLREAVKVRQNGEALPVNRTVVDNVPCSYCSAQVGTWCRNLSGGMPAKYLHAARFEARRVQDGDSR